jgi:hypothetical protein
MDANCLHSALPVAATLGTWEEPGHVVGGNFLQAPTSGEQDRREGCPGLPQLKAARTDSFLPCD